MESRRIIGFCESCTGNVLELEDGTYSCYCRFERPTAEWDPHWERFPAEVLKEDDSDGTRHT